MCTIAIHQPQYLPYLGFFHKLLHCDVFVLLDDVEFMGRGFQNRNKIKTSEGSQWITIPVLQRSNQLIAEVNINHDVPWRRKQLNALDFNYRRSQYFDTYQSDLAHILNKEWTGLSRLNIELMTWLMEVLEIDTPLVLSSTLQSSETGTCRLADICRKLGGSTYLSGPGGRNYMDLAIFSSAGIEVEWQKFTAPVYKQNFPEAGFVENLSVIDALYCCGATITAAMLRQRVAELPCVYS